MIAEYCSKALEKADYRKLDDGTWFAEIPGFAGVWANAGTVEHCRAELLSVLEEWLMLKLRDGDPIPELDGRKLEISEVAVAWAGLLADALRAVNPKAFKFFMSRRLLTGLILAMKWAV